MITTVPKGADKMDDKRTKQIAIRITEETNKILQEEADKLEWSKAKLAEKILREWTKDVKNKKGSSLQFVIHHNENININ